MPSANGLTVLILVQLVFVFIPINIVVQEINSADGNGG